MAMNNSLKRIWRVWAVRIAASFLLVGPCCLAGTAEVRVTEADAKRAATKKTPPEYTDAARQMKASGKVELEVTISPSGAVEDVKIISGNPFLTRPCAKAVKEWAFTPFKENGQPVKAIAPLSFEFRQ
jgi:protein TonB